MIAFDRVSKRYPNGREALAAITFRISAGEMVFLTGRSGAGKSTVLKLIALLERPTRGTVVVNGKNTHTLRPRHIPAFRRGIGMVFQDHKLLADRPVYDNVALPLIVADTPLREIDKRVRAALDQVGLLDLAREVMLLFKRFQEVGVTVVVATHDVHLVHEFAQREIVLDHGHLQGGAHDETLPSLIATR
jgi:cell division transport system ATP-binding protein